MKATSLDEKGGGHPTDPRGSAAPDDLKEGKRRKKSGPKNNMKAKNRELSSERRRMEKGPAAKRHESEGRDNKMNDEQKGAARWQVATNQRRVEHRAVADDDGGASAKLSTDRSTRITSRESDASTSAARQRQLLDAVAHEVPRDVRFYRFRGK